jgi:hypothetical protein
MDRAAEGYDWRSPATWPRRWLAAVFAASAVYSLLVFIVSSNVPQATWGLLSASGYGLALIVLLAWRRRGADVAVGLAFCGGLLAPLAYLIANGLEQPEVAVIARSGLTLLRHGTPYPSSAALAATTNPNAYNPYLPVMSVFGLPRALADSPLTDPRVWFGLVFIVVFWLALRRAGACDPGRWVLLVTGSPVIAFTLATGGDDAPMVAFLCLGFAYLWASGSAGVEPVKAGIALGIAAAMKATAWPAVAVGIALLAAALGWRAALKFTAAALAVVAVCVGPFLVDPRALAENTVLFPLGLAHVVSAAASPLPGHLIADTGHLGRAFVVAALALAGVAVAASLIFRPPRTVPRAMLLLVGAMALMFLLAPSTRYGYFIYPLALVIWLAAVLAGRRASGSGGTGTPEQPAPAAGERPVQPVHRRTNFLHLPLNVHLLTDRRGLCPVLGVYSGPRAAIKAGSTTGSRS